MLGLLSNEALTNSILNWPEGMWGWANNRQTNIQSMMEKLITTLSIFVALYTISNWLTGA